MRQGRAPQDAVGSPPLGSARFVALRLLGRRECTTAEIRMKLSERGYESGDVESTIESLIADGLLDDRRVAAAHVRSASMFKGRGPLRIGRELAARGISDDVAAEALTALSEDDEVAVLQRTLMRKRLPARLSMPDRRRLFQQLLRRGFRADVIAKVLKIRQDEGS